jgi:hypothetical protein
MPVNNQNYTLTFSPGYQGWVSFYSYEPEMIQHMNQYLYTFLNGNLYRHNTNATRNEYYGVAYPSKVTTVLNQEPMVNKIFKTLSYEGNEPWGATLTSDLQTTGFIDSSYFVQKESDWFSFVRNSGTTPADAAQEYPLRSVNGIGNTIGAITIGNNVTFSFALTTDIGSIISIGDSIYFGVPVVAPATLTPIYSGTVTTITVNLAAGQNIIQYALDTAGGGVAPPSGVDVFYAMFVKNQVAESKGILGHYGELTLTNSLTTHVELFAVKSEAMTSFP